MPLDPSATPPPPLLARLDEISRPMTARELDEAFRVQGFSRSKRKELTLALKDLAIIAVVKAPRE